MVFVFDTNVLVSAALSNGTSRVAFDFVSLNNRFCYSTDTLFELVKTLEKPALQKFLIEKAKIEFVSSYLSLAQFIDVKEKVTGCRDPKDDMFLSLAIAGHAAAIVSGDKDLLALHSFRAVPILSPSQFIEHFTK